MTQRKRHITQSARLQDKHERLMTSALQRSITALARDIQAGWDPHTSIGVLDSITGWEQRLSSIIFRYGAGATGLSGTLALENFGTKSAMDIMTDAIRVWLRGYAPARARVVSDYLRNQVDAQLASGLSGDQALASILRIINRKGSARRIARTEVHTAVERGAYLAAQSMGVRMIKEWALGNSPNHRPDHVAADGQTREIDDPFTVGGVPMDHAGDPKAPARQIVNCNCTTLYHLIINGEIRK